MLCHSSLNHEPAGVYVICVRGHHPSQSIHNLVADQELAQICFFNLEQLCYLAEPEISC